jgi:hypothetical protein
VASFVAQCAGRAGTPGCRTGNGGAAPGSKAARGWHLYGRLRCAGCHSVDGNAPGSGAEGLLAAVGPTFKGLAGSKVELASGQTVIADDAYLLTSILAPDAQIVKGFAPGVMTARIPAGSVPPAQARAMIAYIETLR